MYKSRIFSLFAALMILSACVTVNVYFPAAAAEKAADKFIRDIYGDKQQEQLPEGEQPAVEEKPGAWLTLPPARQSVLAQLWSLILPQAQAAQPNINISSPGINRLKSSMKSRHRQLVPFYSNGALGMTNNGLLNLRKASAVPLKQRNVVKKLLADENRERNQLYREVAAGNGHPEWEAQIRSIFARRWVGNAPGGWWFQSGSGGWQQK